ncbi:MAG: 3-oxoacyl-ACP synthase [Bacteroidota bacterium]
MENTTKITAACVIENGKVYVNSKLDFTAEGSASSLDFLKAAYTHYQLNYPKFYKMDSLCKLAMVASELLMRTNRINEKYASEDIALIIANGASSLEIDTEHQVSIADEANFFPSPAVFVYTLPNILIGEIAIRNKIKGENTFFIFDTFDEDFIHSYTDSLMNNDKAKCVIAGWVDFYEDKYRAFLYTVERTNEGEAHTTTNINKLIDNKLNFERN